MNKKIYEEYKENMQNLRWAWRINAKYYAKLYIEARAERDIAKYQSIKYLMLDMEELSAKAVKISREYFLERLRQERCKAERKGVGKMNTIIKAEYKKETGNTEVSLSGNTGEMLILVMHIISDIASSTGKTKHEVIKDILCAIRITEDAGISLNSVMKEER